MSPGVRWGLLAGLAFSATSPLVAGSGWPKPEICLPRGAEAFLVLLLFARKKWPHGCREILRTLFGSAVVSIGIICVILALEYERGVIVQIIVYTSIIWTVILEAVFLKRRPLGIDLFASGGIITGLICLATAPNQEKFWTAAALSMTAAIAVSVAMIFRGKLGQEEKGTERWNTCLCIGQIPVIAFGASFLYRNGVPASDGVLSPICVATIGMFYAAAVIFLNWSTDPAHKVSLAKASILIAVDPVWTMVWMWTFHDEKITPYHLLAVLLIIGSIALRIWWKEESPLPKSKE